MMSTLGKSLAISFAVVSFLAGCANEPTVLDPPFGDSVRHMIAIQTTEPARDASGLDGEKAIKALETYRESDEPLESLEDLGSLSGG